LNWRAGFSQYLLLLATSLSSRRLHFKAIPYQHSLVTTQYLPRATFEELRNEQVCRLVKHCYDNVPYYRQYMDAHRLMPSDFSTVHDITKLPILDKPTLNMNRQALTAQNYHKRDIRYETTGGTTGTPTLFGIDVRNYYRVHANAWRMWEYAGYQCGMKVLLFWGNRIELNNHSRLHEKARSLIENTKMVNFYNFSESQLEYYVTYINKFKPDIIRGFSETIYLFVELCKKHNLKCHCRPKSIILTSENIYNEHKNRIADYFKCEVFEEYGSREFGIMAHECNFHCGLHLAQELFIFEVVDPIDSTCKFDGKGELLVTSLYNYAMPLIRYRIEDNVTLSAENCQCGRSLKLLTNIEGRIADYIITRSKKIIHQGIFNSLFYSSKGILMYQVQQYQIGKAILYIVKDKEFSDEWINKLVSDVQKIFADDLAIKMEFVDHISVTESGKRRAVISHVAPQYIGI
jgi:phenylacetate-CoA ligase